MEYQAKYGKKLRDHCSEGHSILTFIHAAWEAFRIDITYNTLMEWANDPSNDDFRMAMEFAQAAELYYWEEASISAMKTNNTQAMQMAKFMIDQKWALYEAVYKKTVNKNTLDKMKKMTVSIEGANPNRDILQEI